MYHIITISFIDITVFKPISTSYCFARWIQWSALPRTWNWSPDNW